MNAGSADPAAVPVDGFRISPELDLQPFREALVAAGYSQENLASLVAITAPNDRFDAAMVSRRVSTPTPLHLWCRLFLLGHAVPREQLEHVFPAAVLQPLWTAGILRSATDGVRAVARLSPYQDAFAFSDFGEGGEQHVVGVGGASITLAAMTPRRPVASVLDLGTGAGIQAFLAARHAAHVVGTDINPRALNFAAAGARLNRVHNVTWRMGSLYEPVDDEQFDLITANPPFVISPERQFQYRDSGLVGDLISETVIRGASARLREGGRAAIIFNWHHPTKEAWVDRPRQWLADSGCDCWLVTFRTGDSLTYAADWLRNSPVAALDYPARLEEWVNYHAAHGINWISGGVLLLQRRRGPRWQRWDHLEGTKTFGSCSAMVERVLANESFLAGLAEPTQVLDQPLALAPQHVLEQGLRVAEDGWQLQFSRLSLSEGINYGGHVDMHVMRVLGQCDGHRPVRELVTPLATELSVSSEQLYAAFAEVFSKLLRAGLLTIGPEAP